MKKKLNKLLNKIKENKKPLIFLLVLTLVGAVGGTLAYYFNEQSFDNKFTTMTYNVELKEDFNNDWGKKEVTIINQDCNKETNSDDSSTPGSEPEPVTCTPEEKDNNVPVVIRVNYSEKWRKTEGNDTYALSNTVNGNSAVNKNWTSAFTDDFVLGSDGWYYYKKVLNSGDSVKILNSIEKNTTVTNDNHDYDNYDYSLDFNYEAVQASSEAITEVWGKTASISGDNVTWNL